MNFEFPPHLGRTVDRKARIATNADVVALGHINPMIPGNIVRYRGRHWKSLASCRRRSVLL
jgi:hypothetical protein